MKRRTLKAFFKLLPEQFCGRILPVDFQVGIKYGEIQAKLGPLPVLDTFIGATALVNRLTVITHNIADIARTGTPVHDPWS